ncbi:hypothetical protein KAR91_17725 [Candidatus Pacearchaeota archaeon]|nr:hypothetical protein [Candidatus Pacearchaeota archaeon]
MAEEDERELLGSDLIEAETQISFQTTQRGAGFYQVAQQTDFEDRYPNAINDFVQTESVTTIAEQAGVTPDQLKPPFSISDDAIARINEVGEADPLTMSDADLTQLRTSVAEILDGIDFPTTDEFQAFFVDYQKFVAAALRENTPFPTNFREIPLVSTDTSIDAFLSRTGIRKLVAIEANKLAYPFITERYQIPSQLQATLTGSVGLEGDDALTYASISKNVGVVEMAAGSMILITNQTKNISDLLQQKVIVDWISEDSQTIRLANPLLFDLDATLLIRIYQYSDFQILSPGDQIKIPK